MIRPWALKTGLAMNAAGSLRPGIHLVIRDLDLQQRADPVEDLGQLAVLERTGQEVRPEVQVGLELEQQRAIRVEQKGVGIAERLGEIRP